MVALVRFPLLASQAWFMEDLYPVLLNPSRWSLARLYGLAAGTRPEPVRAAVGDLWRRHDALRLRVAPTPLGWGQEVSDPQTPVPLRFIDLSRVPAAQRREEIERMTVELHATLNLEAGPLARFAHLYLGEDEPGRLLLVVHHLAVDGLSFTLMQSELDFGIRAHTAGAAFTFPRAAAFRDCVDAMVDYARSPELLRELDYWKGQPWEQCADLPLDSPDHSPAMARQWSTVRSAMAGEDVRALLQRLPGVLGVHLTHILLGAVAEAVTEWSGGAVCLRVVDHGRNVRRADTTLERPFVLPRRAPRTVGWLASFGYLLLGPRTEPDPADYLRRVRDRAIEAPNRGLGLGMLRWVAPPGDHSDTVAQMWRTAHALFNFGAMGTRPAGSETLGTADEAIGHRPDPLEPRLPLHIRAHTAGGELVIQWDHDPRLRRPESVAALAARCEETLYSYARALL